MPKVLSDYTKIIKIEMNLAPCSIIVECKNFTIVVI